VDDVVLDPAELMAFVPVRDVARATSFYGDVLGCTLESADDYGAMLTFGPTRLRLARVDDTEPPPYTALGFVVPAIAPAVRALTASGVEFRRYEGMGQDDLGVWVAPSGDQVAWFADSEGNTLSLTQEGSFNVGG
jgi:catechol 2,3-dioxygenase-like lactoylglutathione lyase family enzyme